MLKTTKHILTLPQSSIHQPILCGLQNGTVQWDMYVTIALQSPGYFKKMWIVISVSLKWWQRQQWKISPLTSPVSDVDFSMGTLLRWCPSNQQWKQTGMIHPTPIWICKGLWDESHLRKWGTVSNPCGNNTNTSNESRKSGTTGKLNMFPMEMTLVRFSLPYQKVQILYLNCWLHTFPFFLLLWTLLLEKQSEISIHRRAGKQKSPSSMRTILHTERMHWNREASARRAQAGPRLSPLMYGLCWYGPDTFKSWVPPA